MPIFWGVSWWNPIWFVPLVVLTMWWKMVWLIAENKTINVVTVVARKVENPKWQPKNTDTGRKSWVASPWTDFSCWHCPSHGCFLSSGFLHYVNHLYTAVKPKATFIPKEVGKHTVQMDELWYESRQQREGTMGLVSDGCQDSGSDRMSYWRPFLKVGSCIMGFPTECLSPAVPRFIPIIGRHMLRFYRHSRHQPVGKESRLTSYIERLNNTLRQRISRLVRKTLSFSKKLENHGWCYLEFYSWLQSPNPISNAEDSTASIFSILYICVSSVQNDKNPSLLPERDRRVCRL